METATALKVLGWARIFADEHNGIERYRKSGQRFLKENNRLEPIDYYTTVEINRDGSSMVLREASCYSPVVSEIETNLFQRRIREIQIEGVKSPGSAFAA